MKCIWEGHDPALLNALFPEARYLHLIRDPRANIASMMERIGMSHETACKKFVESNETALRFERFEGRYLRVRQEDFIDAREETWKRICEFLGVEYRTVDWDRELNVSPSQEGKVQAKRISAQASWAELTPDTREMGARLGYATA